MTGPTAIQVIHECRFMAEEDVRRVHREYVDAMQWLEQQTDRTSEDDRHLEQVRIVVEALGRMLA